MSIDAINWALEQQDLSSSEKLTLVALANRANDKTHIAWPSWASLIHDTSLCRKTLHKNLISLQQKGKIIKTGDTTHQVIVYKLCGVLNKEDLAKFKAIQKKLSTTSSKNTTSGKSTTSSKSTTSTSSKITTSTSSKITTRNHNKNHQRNHHGEDSIFLPIKTQIQNQLLKHELEVTEEIVGQIEFYVDSKPEQPEEQTIRVAVSLHKRGIWKIPHGYNGITSQSIADKEKEYEEKKKLQHIADAQAFRNITKEVANREVAKSALAGLLTSIKPNYNPEIRMTDD